MRTINDIYKKFESVSLNTLEYAKKLKQENKKLVGCVLEFYPEELIHSLGFEPIPLWGSKNKISDARTYLPSFYCYPLQSVLQSAIDKELDIFDAVLVPVLCDSLKAFGQNLKVVLKDRSIPFVYPQNKSTDHSLNFLKAEYLQIIEKLEALTGSKFDEAKLAESMKLYNKRNSLIREFKAISMHKESISPKLRSVIMRAGTVLNVEEYNEDMEFIIETLKQEEDVTLKNRVVLCGIQCSDEKFLDLLEENGISVVEDNLLSESEQYSIDGLIDEGDLLAGLCQRWEKLSSTSLSYSTKKERFDHIKDLVNRSDAQGVIIIETKFCDPEYYDYPLLKKYLDDNSIKSLFVEIDNFTKGNVSVKIETFLDILKEGVHEKNS
ncbi:MAG: 2-hydroxyacyl-CoA dehydratase family protein [Peptoniphilus sp.]|nr:2-hydroxyacyl-CoA dehydratase family protein [Peptoniphilus sp.]